MAFIESKNGIFMQKSYKNKNVIESGTLSKDSKSYEICNDSNISNNLCEKVTDLDSKDSKISNNSLDSKNCDIYNKSYEKIAIFGGSFSPIHNGHIEMAKLALKKLDIDKLIILPAYQNPLKVSSIFTPQTRLHWAKEVFLDSNIMDTKDSKKNIESRFYKNSEITNLDSKKLENIESKNLENQNAKDSIKTNEKGQSSDSLTINGDVRSTQPCEPAQLAVLKSEKANAVVHSPLFSKELEKRGSPPLRQKSGCFFSQRGSGEGDLRFFAQSANENQTNDTQNHKANENADFIESNDKDSKEKLEITESKITQNSHSHFLCQSILAQPPFCKINTKSVNANFTKKQENVESNVKDSITKKILISDYEISQNRAVASIESILHFKNLYNVKKIYFLIGGDNLFQLPKWKDFEKLKKVTEFVVFMRKDSINLNYPCGEKIDSQNTESNQKDSKKYYDFANKYNIKITLLDFSFNISSTEIRKNIESNIDFIPQKVRDSIILELKK